MRAPICEPICEPSDALQTGAGKREAAVAAVWAGDVDDLPEQVIAPALADDAAGVSDLDRAIGKVPGDRRGKNLALAEALAAPSETAQRSCRGRKRTTLWTALTGQVEAMMRALRKLELANHEEDIASPHRTEAIAATAELGVAVQRALQRMSPGADSLPIAPATRSKVLTARNKGRSTEHHPASTSASGRTRKINNVSPACSPR